jgi:phosphatidylserine/phosphatidylglycerophosphate/cardiolipin synthase-like enzyme
MTYTERANTEFIYLEDVEIDFDIRIQLIRQARYSIDIVSLSQSIDCVGIVFLHAIRESQRLYSTKVRFLFDRIASVIDRDFRNISGKMIADSSLKYPGQVVCTSTMDKRRAGLAWDDFFHQKALIIDYGTDNEYIFIGGRGYTRFFSLVADAGYLIRPINPDLPYLGTDIQESFNQIWKIANEISPLLKPIDYDRKNDIKQFKFSSFAKTEEKKKKVEEILNTIQNKESSTLKDFQFIPESTQLTTNNLIQTLHDKGVRKSRNREILPDLNHIKFIDEIISFEGMIEISSYSIGFTDGILNALADFVQRGNILNLYTNSKESHGQFVPWGLSIYYTTENLIRLVSLAKEAQSNINVYFLDTKKAVLHGQHLFTHRKLALFLGKKANFVYTGTDNFTWSSAKKNDEWMIKIADERMAKYLHTNILKERNWYSKITIDEIIDMNSKRPQVYKLLRNLIRNNY